MALKQEEIAVLTLRLLNGFISDMQKKFKNIVEIKNVSLSLSQFQKI
jgi:hypothetical protein